MVLPSSNRLEQSQFSYQCGIASKCSVCMYKLICPKSPFCCISGSGCDLTPVLSAISQLNSLVTSSFSTTNGDIASLQTDISSIGATLNTMNESINSIGATVNEILARLPATANASVFSVDPNVSSNTVLMSEMPISNQNVSNDIEEPVTPMTAEVVEPNSLATYVPKDNDTVLVQKKGLFGKTKWVEEKKK